MFHLVQLRQWHYLHQGKHQHRHCGPQTRGCVLPGQRSSQLLPIGKSGHEPGAAMTIGTCSFDTSTSFISSLRHQAAFFDQGKHLVHVTRFQAKVRQQTCHIFVCFQRPNCNLSDHSVVGRPGVNEKSSVTAIRCSTTTEISKQVLGHKTNRCFTSAAQMQAM